MRTPEQLKHHYDVERELAERLRHSTREERRRLLPGLYDELFKRIPDHPRLTVREAPAAAAAAVRTRLALLRPFLIEGGVFLEFAPGDCRLALDLCRSARQVYAVDLSQQSGELSDVPANFKFIAYDGFELDLSSDSVDVAFSYMMIEHVHPDDVGPHLELVRRLLKPGGVYVVATPHRFSGPHDISRNFSAVPQGLHLKEWTYAELQQALATAGFARTYPIRKSRVWQHAWINGLNQGLESLIGVFPLRLRQRAASRLFESVILAAVK